MKKCSKCKIEKELTCFQKDRQKKDDLRSDCKSCAKVYNESNKQKKKEYYQSNKEYKIAYSKKRYQENKEYYKKWHQDNKERINKLKTKKRKVDPLFKMTHNLRTQTSQVFKRKGYTKNTKTQEMLGVSWEVCKAHIERQFTKGMSWENQGEWHIDHIIPLASANTEEELKKLCHYSNLQPLWAVDNLMKSAKINGQQNKFRF